jgi:hypothetical protein
MTTGRSKGNGGSSSPAPYLITTLFVPITKKLICHGYRILLNSHKVSSVHHAVVKLFSKLYSSFQSLCYNCYIRDSCFSVSAWTKLHNQWLAALRPSGPMAPHRWVPYKSPLLPSSYLRAMSSYEREKRFFWVEVPARPRRGIENRSGAHLRFWVPWACG